MCMPRVHMLGIFHVIGRGRGRGSWASRFGKRRGPALLRSGGQHGQLAAPTSAMPAQVAELGRLDHVGPRSAPVVKKRSRVEGGEEGLQGSAIR